MGIDHSLPLRRAVVAALAADPAVAAIVEARVYGPAVPSNPKWPYVRCGLVIAAPWEATKLNGMQATFAVSGFAKSADESAAAILGAAIQKALDGNDLDMDGSHCVSLDWTQSQVVRDTAEADAYHAIVQFEATTSDDY